MYQNKVVCMPDKQFVNELAAVFCSGIFAGIGGILHYLLKVSEGKPFKVRELCLYSLISAFAGLIAYEVLAYFNVPPAVDGALCGLCGWSSTRLLRIIELVAHQRANVKKEDVE